MPQDQERGRFLRKTLSTVGTSGFLAHGMQLVTPQQAPGCMSRRLCNVGISQPLRQSLSLHCLWSIPQLFG